MSVAGCRQFVRGNLWQILAIAGCLLFGIAMIANTQMGGEAMWFWYATLLHDGAKLYSDLHLALQPLFVLETDAWISLFGTKCIVTEIPSALHVLVFCAGVWLLLRESDWPDWQKAILLAGAFVTAVQCTSYRFDDYHIAADTFILYSLVLLLWLSRAEGARREAWLCVGLGVLSGFTITTRLNDGVALLVSAMICIPFLARKRKLANGAILLAVALATVFVVVKLTGDSMSSYVSNSVIKAAGSKGGTGSILATPFLMFRNAVGVLRHAGRGMLLEICLILLAGVAVARFWAKGLRYLVALQMVMAGIIYAVSSHTQREQLRTGSLVFFLSICVIILSYVLAPVVLARFVLWKTGRERSNWDPREVLVLVLLAEIASASASTAAEPYNAFYAQMAMLLLLIPVVQPFRRWAAWANPFVVTIFALLLVTGVSSKYYNPYSWNNYVSSPMFQNRVWYQHPVYGPMYLDRDLLNFIKPVCAEMDHGSGEPELLSLPYAYPNYFCAMGSPWHGYVQTYFDTSTRSSIEHLMQELNATPPKWIVYQRQLYILSGAERLYNHGQPLAHRELDTMIMQKIASGEWTLVDKRNYLQGDGWLVIRTRP